MATSSLIFAKLDPGFFNNRKILRAGRDGRDVFLAVLCINAGRGGPGWIPGGDLEPWYMAHYLGITQEQARSGIEAVLAAELVALEEVDGVTRVTIVGWSEDWSRRAKTDAERAHDYRERKKPKLVENQDPSQPSRDDVTTKSRVTDQRRGEERRERSDSPSASLLPGDWKPDAAAAQLAKDLELDVRGEASKFADRMRSGERKSADWHAEFRNWLRRGAEFQERNGKRKPKPGATKSAPVRDVVLGVSEPSRGPSQQGASRDEVQQGSEPKRGKP